ADLEREGRHLAGRVGMVRRQLAAGLGLGVAAPAGTEHHGSRLEDVVAADDAPAGVGRLELAERRVREAGPGAALPRLAQLFGDGVARAVADLEEALAGRTAAAGEPVAAVLTGELDPELLEPGDRSRRLDGQHLDEPRLGGVV